MAKTARIEFRVEPDLKARVVAQADRRGQKLATFIERALESALSGAANGPSPSSERAPGLARRDATASSAASTQTPAKSRDDLAMERQRKLNEGRG